MYIYRRLVKLDGGVLDGDPVKSKMGSKNVVSTLVIIVSSETIERQMIPATVHNCGSDDVCLRIP